MRNFIFGVEDSLVSTVGLLSGVAAAGLNKTDIFLTGLVLIFVEAFSMGIGSFLSEDTTEDAHIRSKVKGASIIGALIMFISYFLAGLIPLTPYILFKVQNAFVLSNVFSLTSLFVLGLISASLYKRPLFKLAIKMSVMGGIAILVGIFVGRLVQNTSLH